MKGTKTIFVNLTPHDINVVVGEEERVIPKSGKVARLIEARFRNGDVGGIWLDKVIYDGIAVKDENGNEEEITTVADLERVLNLKNRRNEIYVLIVSLPLLMGLKNTNIPIVGNFYDNYIFVAPDTNNAIRDEKGRIKAVRGFIYL